jgi:hypothetical protein
MRAAKLTLSVDPKVIEAAKEYAAETGTSVSQLVEDFLSAVASRRDADGFLAGHTVPTLYYLASAGVAAGCEVIATRDPKRFRQGALPALTPSAALLALKAPAR